MIINYHKCQPTQKAQNIQYEFDLFFVCFLSMTHDTELLYSVIQILRCRVFYKLPR